MALAHKAVNIQGALVPFIKMWLWRKGGSPERISTCFEKNRNWRRDANMLSINNQQYINKEVVVVEVEPVVVVQCLLTDLLVGWLAG